VTSLALLGIAGLLAVAGPRAVARPWAERAPRLAVAAWSLLAVTGLTAVVLAGLVLVVPVTALGTDLAELLRACALAVQAAYATATPLPVVGAVVAIAVPVWAGAGLLAGLVPAALERARLRRSLAALARRDEALDALVLDAPEAAAYCMPGRGGHVVITTGALGALTEPELAAVLAHERAHLTGRHHLLVGVATGLARAFPRVPLFAAGLTEVRWLVELLADDAATRRTDRVEVASALVCLAGMRAPAPALAAVGSAGAARVHRLLQSPRPLPVVQRVAAVGALVLVAATPLVLAGYPAFAATASDLCPVTFPPVPA
jgi:Zn-dependent protease with chaperone function